MELDEEVLLEEEGDLVEMDKKKEEEERMTNSISISPHGLLPCPLCRADISLRAGTLAKVFPAKYWFGIFHSCICTGLQTHGGCPWDIPQH